MPTGIAFSSDGATAYVAFSRNNSLAVIDAQARKVIQEIPVGIAPFGVALTKAGTLYVSNRGGRRAVEGDTVAPSSGSQVVTDPLTGSSVSGTVSVVNAQTFEVRELQVGLAPSGLALSPDEKTLAVANGHSDSISPNRYGKSENHQLEDSGLSRRHARQPADQRCIHTGWKDSLCRVRRHQCAGLGQYGQMDCVGSDPDCLVPVCDHRSRRWGFFD